MRKKLKLLIIGLVSLLPFSQTANAQWVQSKGTDSVGVLALAVIGNNIFAGTTAGVSLSTDDGSTWNAVDSGLKYDTYVSPLGVNGNNIFAGTNGYGVFVSANNGTSWSAAYSGLTTWNVTCFTGIGGNTFVGTRYQGIFISTNNGTSWTPVNSGLTDTFVACLAISGNNIFAGTLNGGTNNGGVYLSSNNGASWTAVNNGLTNRIGGGVQSITMSSTNIFAGTYGGVFLSSNNGTSWTQVNSGLTDTFITSLAASGNNIFAGTYYHGVYLSTNNGTSWTAVNSGLTGYNLYIKSLAVCGNYIYVGTSGPGVWSRPLSDFPPSAPSLITPANNASGISVNPTLSWNPSASATSYSLQVSTDAVNFTSPVVNQIGLTTTTYNASGLGNNITYYWHVNAKNVTATSAWSAVWSFTTTTTTAVLPSSFTIVFAGVSLTNGSLRYGIPKQCQVSLAAYDIRGCLIRHFISAEQSPGYYTVNLKQTQLATGRYFLRFIAGDFRCVKPFLINR